MRALIQDAAGLETVVEELAPLPLLTVDTEFHWERTYHPRLGLLQLAGRGEDGQPRAFAVDPLAVGLDPVLELLADVALAVPIAALH